MPRFLLAGLLLTIPVCARGQFVVPPSPPPVVPLPPPIIPPPPPPPPPITLPPVTTTGGNPGGDALPVEAPITHETPVSPGPPSPSAFLVALLVPLGVLGAVSGTYVDMARRRRTSGGLIRIIAPPPGEAPEHVRAAWVGVELPLVGGVSQPTAGPGRGVVSGNAGVVWVGYVVDGRVAVQRLAAQCPEAAAWWRANAPHILGWGYGLLFPTDVCQRLG